ncbi:MAG: hypothetical protein M3N54_02645, partial [Acidobacteriota bacterium]|nr:hypothetical protein [Acidobacteriota bacterium]
MTFFWILTCGGIAQTALSNDAVIKLIKAGLSDDLIVSTINAAPGAYNSSADAIITLKAAGASDRLVSVIVLKASSRAIADQAPVPVAPRTTEPAIPAQVTQSFASSGVQDLTAGQASNRPRVFLQSASKGTNRNAARDQSMEMSKDIERDCPAVRITLNSQMADYTIVLN